MAKNNYYAVKNGHQIGIFENWADCSKQVHGFAGAIYKGFQTLGEAQTYLEGQEAINSEGFETEEEIMASLGEHEMIAYVDGSNKGDGSAFSWGIVAFSKYEKKTFNGMSTDPEQCKYRNISGELFAAVRATKFAIDNKCTKLTIYHDYAGIRHWAIGEWKTKNKLGKDYEAFFQRALKVIDVEFVKMKTHPPTILLRRNA